MARWTIRGVVTAIALSLVALCSVIYAADWLLLQMRERQGSAHGSVMVESTDIVREKGNRLEYYDNPPQSVPCVRSLFPHEGQPACWWLARHTDEQRYLN
jgi:hypothetical protein